MESYTTITEGMIMDGKLDAGQSPVLIAGSVERFHLPRRVTVM